MGSLHIWLKAGDDNGNHGQNCAVGVNHTKQHLTLAALNQAPRFKALLAGLNHFTRMYEHSYDLIFANVTLPAIRVSACCEKLTMVRLKSEIMM
jgi:hypothetical protein